MNAAIYQSASDELGLGRKMTPRERKAWDHIMGAWPLVNLNGCYSRDAGREEIRWARKQKYGSVLLAWLALTILGAAISFLVEKLLARLWPDKEMGFYGSCDSDFAAQLTEWSRA